MFPFKRAKLLGKRSFGTVFEGVWNDQRVAIKRVFELNEKWNKERDEEGELLLRQINHLNVIQLLHENKDDDSRYFVFEYCEATLDYVITRIGQPEYKGPKLPPDFDVLLQLAQGLEHIHSKMLVHRNIKPNNVLVHVDQTGKNVTMKWSGFSLCTRVDERGTYAMDRIEGTMNWMAPEILLQLDEGQIGANNSQQDDRRGTVKSDIFAGGLVFGYFLSDGVHPYGAGDLEIQSNMRSGNPVNMPNIQPSYIRDIIKKMLTSQPEDRMTSSEIVHQLSDIKKRETKLISLCSTTNPNLDEMVSLIRGGLDVNCRNEAEMSPLLLLIKNRKHDDPKQSGNESRSFMQAALKLFIEHGVDVEHTDKGGWNALHFFCQYYQKEDLIPIAQLLIEQGVDINRQEEYGKNAMHILCRYNKNDHLIELVRFFIENKIKINCTEYDGWNAMHFLCRYYSKPNLIDIVDLLIEREIDVNSITNDGMNALHYLCTEYEEDNLVDIVRLFVKSRDFDINCKQKDGRNALHLLCRYHKKNGLINIAQLLIEHDIKVNEKDKNGDGALNLLCQFYQNENLIEIVQLLIRHKIDVNSTNAKKCNALHHLSKNYKKGNLLVIVQLLIENNINVHYNNVLHYLCQFSRSSDLIDIIRLLIEHKIDVNGRNISGRNSFHYLCLNKKNENLIDTFRLLIEKGIDINCKTNHGGNALTLLCQYHHHIHLIDIVRLLIDCGIEVNCTDNDGDNALIVLCWNYKEGNLIDIARLLIEKGININCTRISKTDEEGKKFSRLNALHFLCWKQPKENLFGVVELLIQHGIDTNAMTEGGTIVNARALLLERYSEDEVHDIIDLIDNANSNPSNQINQKKILVAHRRR